MSKTSHKKRTVVIGLTTFFIGILLVNIAGHFRVSQTTSQEMTVLVEELNLAIIKKDEPTLRDLLSENIRIKTTSSGWALSREELVQQLTDANLHSFTIENLSIAFPGELISVNFDQEEVMLHNNREIVHRANYTYLFAWTDESWKIVEILRHD